MGDSLSKPFYSSREEQEKACDRIRPYATALIDIGILERLLVIETDPATIDRLIQSITKLNLFVDKGIP